MLKPPTELLLDEPTNHLDIQHQLEILSLVSKLPITSIVALHDLNLAAMFCDRLVVLKAGRVLATGTAEEVLTEDLIWQAFGVRTAVGSSLNPGRRHIHFLVDARAPT
jgi:iron complex transport system ATP-binding protein